MWYQFAIRKAYSDFGIFVFQMVSAIWSRIMGKQRRVSSSSSFIKFIILELLVNQFYVEPFVFIECYRCLVFIVLFIAKRSS